MLTNHKTRLERLETTYRGRGRRPMPTRAEVLTRLGFEPNATAGEVAAALELTGMELHAELLRLAQGKGTTWGG